MAVTAQPTVPDRGEPLGATHSAWAAVAAVVEADALCFSYPRQVVLDCTTLAVDEGEFVALVGPGPLAGVLALAFYTTGILGKLQFEAIEGLPRDPIDALAALGTSRALVVRHVVLPEEANHFLSHVLFVFEYNVRHGAVLGLVGAGGIGTLMMGYLTFFQLDKLVTVLAVIFATVLAIDAASHSLRARFTDQPAARPRWITKV